MIIASLFIRFLLAVLCAVLALNFGGWIAVICWVGCFSWWATGCIVLFREAR